MNLLKDVFEVDPSNRLKLADVGECGTRELVEADTGVGRVGSSSASDVSTGE